MATIQQIESFFNMLGPIVRSIAKEKGMNNISLYTCLCQAANETGYGTSKRMMDSNGLFGIKSTKNWIAKGGKVYNTNTKEVEKGITVVRNCDFRAYDSIDDAVKDYFDLIRTDRYKESMNKTSVEECISYIINHGYATSGDEYIDIVRRIWMTHRRLIEFWSLNTYSPITNTPNEPSVLSIAKGWLGYNEADGSHRQIIDVYNAHTPLPRNYKVKYTDPWCATFVSACMIKSGNAQNVPIECSCQNMIELYKKQNRWQEDESGKPQIGDIIFYDWQDNGIGDNMGWSDHVGIVAEVNGNTIKVIEGNYKDAVGYREITINGKYIRGYGKPNYKEGILISEDLCYNKISYKINNIYTLQYDMYVRTSPAGSKRSFNSITDNAKKNGYKDKEGFAILRKGTKVTCKGIAKVNNAEWMCIPSGYVCALGENNIRYIK